VLIQCFTKSHIRYDVHNQDMLRGAKRKRDVPALWETTLGTVISNLSTQHTDEFVQSVLGDSILRTRFTEELLRKAHHVPELSDSDLVEFVDLRDSNSLIRYCKVGDMPYWLNAAIKTQFKTRCAHDSKLSNHHYSGGLGNVTPDGRLQFDLSYEDPESMMPLIDAYFAHLEQLIREECIPNKEDTAYAECDEVDVNDVAPHVEYDTCLYDAWWMNINNFECNLREDYEERFHGLYELEEETWWKAVGDGKAGQASVSTVWVRKPRVRIVFHD